MKKRINILFSFLLLLILIIMSGVISCVKKNDEKLSDFKAEVDAYIKPYLDLGGYSGTVLIAKNGEILFRKGYGMASYEFDVANTAKTKFQIASLSKSFTSAAIMILQERGKLSVHDPLSKFIPDYPGGKKITIHHLLTHTSGIPNVNNFPEYSRDSRFPQTLDEIIKMFKDKPLMFEPGEKYSYSNSNYNLLAYIIEKVSGVSYGEFLRKNIFQPLEMNETGHHGEASAIIKNLASGYMPAGLEGIEKAPYIDWSIKTGNGSLYSTVDDLYKWDRALYTDKILKKSSLNEMFKEHLKGIGYGWFIRKRHGRRVTAYNGRSPGYTSYLERYINDDACIIVLSNNYAPASHMMVEGLSAILFHERYKPLDVPKNGEISPAIFEQYVGRYKFGPDFYRSKTEVRVVKKNNHLAFQWSRTYTSPLKYISETMFLDRFFWAFIIFEKDKAGTVKGFIWRDTDDYSARRIEEKD